MNTNLNARLKRLEEKQQPAELMEPVLCLPWDGDSDLEAVQVAWDIYMKTGKSDSPVIISPPGVEAVRTPDGTQVIITEDKKWYGNDAHERASQRQTPLDDAS